MASRDISPTTANIQTLMGLAYSPAAQPLISHESKHQYAQYHTAIITMPFHRY